MSSISFANALKIHPTAMLTRADRSEILANNLANEDTPGFKARDMDFQAILKGEQAKRLSVKVDRTDDRHIAGRHILEDTMLYRVPNQPSIDGNTVDGNIENAEFTKNAMAYNASFDFTNRKFKGLTGAIKGE